MNSISAALLAGGKSSRMGRDKCLVEIGDAPLWQRQTELLSTLTSEVLVVAPKHPEWIPAGARWAEDVVRDHGPLGGFAAALAAASHPRLVILAVDLPAMTAEYLNSLLADSTDNCGVVPEIDGLFQPLSAVYPRSALAAARIHLTEPDKSLQCLVRQLIAEGKMRSVTVCQDDLALFRNLNTATD
jgi:molybdopterin-guanine dinucleotide biosynthesis protein A